MANILICDDAEFMRVTIKGVLENAGHKVVGEADDVPVAIELYDKLKPDLVTMDILMKHSGVEAIRSIIKSDPGAKVVVISVLNEQEAEVVEAIRAGAQGIVTKPIKKETLLAEVERVLNKS